MRDPERLLEAGASELELALLRAAAVEEPPSAARQRLLASLGLGSAALGSIAAASSAAQSAPASAAASGVSVLKLATAKLGVKALILSLTGAGLVGGVWLAAQPPTARVGPAAQTAPLERPAGESAAEALPSVPAAGPSLAREAPSVPAVSASLAREVSLLDQARGHLQRGEARRALRSLDDYAAAHAAGALRQEAGVLRIEALRLGGDTARARRAAESFLREYPASPHAARVRGWLSPDAR